MKSMAEIMAGINAQVAASRFTRAACGGVVAAPAISGQTMQVIEKKVSVAVGLNEMARRLGCSRGHLSLVIHGHRTSGRLERKLRKLGIKLQKEAV